MKHLKTTLKRIIYQEIQGVVLGRTFHTLKAPKTHNKHHGQMMNNSSHILSELQKRERTVVVSLRVDSRGSFKRRLGMATVQ